MPSPSKVQEPGPLQTERLPNGDRKLLRNLVVKLDDGVTYTVPAGSITDFSSIPWLARPFIRWSRVDIAGVVHDYLYWCQQADISRRRADEVWRELAGAGQHSLDPIRTWLAWAGLVAGGWCTYSKARKATPTQRTERRGCPQPPNPKPQRH